MIEKYNTAMCYSTWDTLVVYNISTKYEYPPAAFDTRILGARGQRCTPRPVKHPGGPAPGNTLAVLSRETPLRSGPVKHPWSKPRGSENTWSALLMSMAPMGKERKAESLTTRRPRSRTCHTYSFIVLLYFFPLVKILVNDNTFTKPIHGSLLWLIL